MDDRTALMAAIIAFPDEDVPRLMYADWLTESGQADYGEFIRVQCELARMKPPLGLDRNAPVGMFGERERKFHKWGKRSQWGRQRAALQKRERFLRDVGTNCPGFLEIPAHWGQPFWKRGFIESLRLPAADWLAHGDTILAAHPVQEVTLTTWPEADIVGKLLDRAGDNQAFLRDAGTNAEILTRLFGRVWPTVKTWSLRLAGVNIEGLQAAARAFATAGVAVAEAVRAFAAALPAYRQADFTPIIPVS